MNSVVADNPDQRIPQKMFHSKLVLQIAPSGLPQQLVDSQIIRENFLRVKQEAKNIVQDELERIMNTPGLERLIVRRENAKNN